MSRPGFVLDQVDGRLRLLDFRQLSSARDLGWRASEGQGQNAVGGLKDALKGEQAHGMSRNILYLVNGLLPVVVAASAIYFFYQETQRPSLDIKVDEQGITVK